MEFLITEKQLQKILEQEEDSRLTESMKTLHNFTKEMVSRVSRAYNLNLKMLLTWGTSVGGFVMPLDNWIKNNNFSFTDDQRLLVLCGVTFILFFEGKRGLSKILEAIKKENLKEEFEVVLDKGEKFKLAFQGFMETVKGGSSVFLETIAYSFLIPIITDILSVARGTESVKEAAEYITQRLVASGVILLGREFLIVLIRRIVRKFK